MRMLLNITLPAAEFNETVRDGSIGEKISNILENTKPEAVYFTDQNGERGAIVVVDIPDASKIPMLAEPWYLNFNARVRVGIAMTPDDLRRANLETLGKKWA